FVVAHDKETVLVVRIVGEARDDLLEPAQSAFIDGSVFPDGDRHASLPWFGTGPSNKCLSTKARRLTGANRHFNGLWLWRWVLRLGRGTEGRVRGVDGLWPNAVARFRNWARP